MGFVEDFIDLARPIELALFGMSLIFGILYVVDLLQLVDLSTYVQLGPLPPVEFVLVFISLIAAVFAALLGYRRVQDQIELNV
jgi:hypothetical protein